MGSGRDESAAHRTWPASCRQRPNRASAVPTAQSSGMLPSGKWLYRAMAVLPCSVHSRSQQQACFWSLKTCFFAALQQVWPLMLEVGTRQVIELDIEVGNPMSRLNCMLQDSVLCHGARSVIGMFHDILQSLPPGLLSDCSTADDSHPARWGLYSTHLKSWPSRWRPSVMCIEPTEHSSLRCHVTP